MELLGYSERGLLNALLYEIAYGYEAVEAQALIAGLFDLIHWPAAVPPASRFRECCKVLVEQSFSDFGDADALFLFAADSGGAAAFWEAKRGETYSVKKAWDAFITSFRTGVACHGLTSNLFSQLYFKQRLAAALQAYPAEDAHAGLPFQAPFALSNRDRELGSNLVVRRAVELLRKHLNEAYYVLLIPEAWTSELGAWWAAEVIGGPPVPQRWDPSHWGVITIPEIIRFCEDNGLDRTLAVVKHNEGQLYRHPSAPGDAGCLSGRDERGVSIIYAPEIQPDRCLHFSWAGDGCALRDYRSGSLARPPRPDRSRRTSQVAPHIAQEFRYTTRPPATELLSEWRTILARYDQLWGIGPDQRDPGGNS